MKCLVKIHVVCGLLFVYAATAVPVPEDPATANDTDVESLNDEPQSDEDLYVLDDNDNPVKINMKETYPETIDQTKMDIQKRVQFYLYTKNTVNKPEEILVDDVNRLRYSHFDPRKDTKFVTHGWTNSRRSKSCVLVRDAFLKHGDYNVIVIDWSSISLRPYIWSSNRVVLVAQYVSRMINFLVSQGMKGSQVTIVGHSLGGHIAGLSAHYAKHKINYVVALDPALPNFLLAGTGSRVSRGDANYVQVIHTNGGFLGYKSSIGDADFFPNGGRKQTGCTIDIGGSCSHARSVHYFAESINSDKGFLAKRCNSYNDFKNGKCNSNADIHMGGVAPRLNVKGDYYLRTNKKSPFAMGRA